MNGDMVLRALVCGGLDVVTRRAVAPVALQVAQRNRRLAQNYARDVGQVIALVRLGCSRSDWTEAEEAERAEAARRLRESAALLLRALSAEFEVPTLLDKEAPGRNRGRSHTGQGVSTRRIIRAERVRRKVKNFIDLKSDELARAWTAWRKEDVR